MKYRELSSNVKVTKIWESGERVMPQPEEVRCYPQKFANGVIFFPVVQENPQKASLNSCTCNIWVLHHSLSTTEEPFMHWILLCALDKSHGNKPTLDSKMSSKELTPACPDLSPLLPTELTLRVRTGWEWRTDPLRFIHRISTWDFLVLALHSNHTTGSLAYFERYKNKQMNKHILLWHIFFNYMFICFAK